MGNGHLERGWRQPMFFTVTLYISLAAFLIGLACRFAGWLTKSASVGQDVIPAGARVGAIIGLKLKAIFSAQLVTTVRVFVGEVLLQIGILKDRDDRLLWLEHFLIAAGFMLLLIFHALGAIISANLFEDYQATLNPFMFLRNLFGCMVLAGLVLALIRRAMRPKEDRLKTTGRDWYALILVAVIIASGFMLEATKITSQTVFGQMVEEYSDSEAAGDISALESLWVTDYGLVTTNKTSLDSATLAKGRELNDNNCLDCHDKPGSAFVSYPLSRIFGSAGGDGLRNLLYYIHFLACFVGLALLPWTKMFHIVATPASLYIAALTDKDAETPAAAANRKIIEQDGCEPCAVCRDECPIRKNRADRTGGDPQFGPEGEYAVGVDWNRLGARPIREND